MIYYWTYKNILLYYYILFSTGSVRKSTGGLKCMTFPTYIVACQRLVAFANKKIKFRLGNIQISDNIRISFYNRVLSLSTIEYLVVAWDSMHLSSYHKVKQIPIERCTIFTIFYSLFFKSSTLYLYSQDDSKQS